MHNPNQDLTCAKRPRLLLPWETGFAGLVFRNVASETDRQFSDLLMPQWESDFIRAASQDNYAATTEIVDSSDQAESLLYDLGDTLTLVGKHRAPMEWSAKLDDERRTALSRWDLIVHQNLQGSKLGKQIQRLQQCDNATELTAELVEDTFTGKATRTVSQRGGSLLLYTRWRSSLPLFRGIFPFVEDDVYNYIRSLRILKAPATRAQRFREAIGFAFGVVGAYGAEDILASGRCKGAALRSLETKAEYRQMDPLYARQLDSLERGVFCCAANHDQIMSGNLAALAHWRARASDVRRCRGEPFLDINSAGVGYVEIGAMETKTTKRDKRRRVLPLVGHADGVSGLPWARRWLELRKAAGLDCTGGPLLVSIMADGTWTKSRLSSHDGTVWMMQILLEM